MLMNHTPRSTMRRARRHARANEGLSGSTPYSSSVAFDSLLRSISSGAEVCSRAAISYDEMRVAISGSPSAVSRWRLSEPTRSNVSFCNGGSNPGGLDTLRIASPLFRRRTPLYRLGKKPLDQFAAPPLIPDPVDMTTKAGRSLVSAPMPYVTHEPMLGRPGCEKPVLKKICAGAWLNWS